MPKKYEFKPIFRTPNYKRDPLLVFVLIAYEELYTPIYAIIKDFVESIEIDNNRLKCNRADTVPQPGKMVMNKIWRLILNSRMVIAELSSLNINVFYELGLTDVVGRDVILLWNRGEDEKIPFDVNARELLKYNLKTPADVKKFKIELEKQIRYIIDPKPQEVTDEESFTTQLGGSSKGYCIRCGKTLIFDIFKPHCPECHGEWKRFGDPEYKETYCHSCNEMKPNISKGNPICVECDSGMSEHVILEE